MTTEQKEEGAAGVGVGDTRSDAERVCHEAYQVVGSLLGDLGKFDTPEAEKILDNLSQAKIVHDDVLPWPSYGMAIPDGGQRGQ